MYSLLVGRLCRHRKSSSMAASNSQESNIHDSEKFMRQALQQAELAYGIGEVPVGCVFVYQGRVVAAGRNNTNITNNVFGNLHRQLGMPNLKRWTACSNAKSLSRSV